MAVQQTSNGTAHNYLIDARPAGKSTFANYILVACYGWDQKICIYRRDGPCDPANAHLLAASLGPDIAAALRRIGIGPR